MAVSFGIEVEGFIPHRKWQELRQQGHRNNYTYVLQYIVNVGNDMQRAGLPDERTAPLRNAFYDGYGHGDFSEGQGWKVTSDVSVADDRGNTHNGGGATFELVSPVLSGKYALDQCSDLLRALVALGAKVNRSCGQHIHFGVMDKSWFSWNKFGPFANNLNNFYRHFWPVFLSILPKSRGESCQWICYSSNDQQAPMNDYGSSFFLNLENARNLRGITNRKVFSNGAYRNRDRVPENAIYTELDGDTRDGWRYKSVNWTTSMWRNGTVEFRQGMATLSPLHTIQWIRMLRTLYTISYAPEYRQGGRYYEEIGDWLEKPQTVDGMMDAMRASASMRRYWVARAGWYSMTTTERREWSTSTGGISANQSNGEITAKGRRKWFVVNRANNY